MPNWPPGQIDYHVFVGGPLNGQCWTLRECLQIGPPIDSYALTHEVATGSLSGRQACVWRPVKESP